MKIGCCVNMLSKEPGGTGVEYVEKLAVLGFEYVELPLAEMTALPEDKFSALAERVCASGIRCEACNNFFPKTMRLTGPGVDDGAVDEYVNKALARAAALGAQCVVFGSGPAKNIPEGFSREQGYRQVVSLLKRIDGKAKKRGITVTVEPLRKAECNLINTFEEGCRLAKDVNGENIRVLVDYYHLREENEPTSHVAQSGEKYLRHAHFARSRGRGYPQDIREDENYAPFFAALKGAGYGGRLSLEAYTSDFDGEAPVSLALLRELTSGL